MMSTVKLSEHQLKTRINKQAIQNRNIYYTLCKKSAMNISIISNWRLLIFDLEQCILYYVNTTGTGYVAPPFVTVANIPQPKNDVAFVPLSVVKNPQSSKDISVQFNKKNAKGENIGTEWVFTLETEKIAHEWVAMIKEQKKKRANKALGLKSEEGQVVQDSLAFGMLAGLKKQEQKSDNAKEQEEKRIALGNFLMMEDKKQEEKEVIKESRISDTSKKQPKKQSPKNNNQGASNIQSRISNSRGELDNSNLNKSNISRSNISDNKRNILEESHLSKRDVGKSNVLEASRRESSVPLTNSRFNNTYVMEETDRKSQVTGRQEGVKDWNLQFWRNPTEQVINQFNLQVLQLLNSISLETLLAVYNTYEQEVQNLEFIQPILIDPEGTNILFYCSVQESRAAHLLECQFHNYHFMIESGRQSLSFAVNAPLSCLIRFMGLTILAKAAISGSDRKNNSKRRVHNKREIVYQLRELEKLTKISSKVLQSNIDNNSCVFYDLSDRYLADRPQVQSQENKRVIYIDRLTQYLPYMPASAPQGKPQQLARSELLQNLSTSYSYLHPQDMRTAGMLTKASEHYVSQLAQLLSNHDALIMGYAQLEELMHEHGLTAENDKILADLYNKMTNKMPKKYVHGIMVARVIALSIWQALREQIISYSQQKSNPPNERRVQDQLKALLTQQLQTIFQQGGNAAISAEAWKNISLQFKKNYKFALNTSEVFQEAGFLLGTVMELLPLDYDLNSLDKEKVLFSDGRILGNCFVKKVGFKFLAYEGFRTENVERVLTLICSPLAPLPPRLSARNRKKYLSEHDTQEIRKVLDSNDQQRGFILTETTKAKILAALSYSVPPLQIQAEGSIGQLQRMYGKEVYGLLEIEPPNQYVHQITINYLKHLLKANREEDFKKTIQKYLECLMYWLGEDQVSLCAIYQLLADYYAARHLPEDSINFLKQSLTTCIRAGGTHTRLAGSKYYLLGESLLRYGYKAQAKANFQKAQINMEAFMQAKSVRNMSREYPLVLMKLGVIALSEGQNDSCIHNCINAINIMSEVQQVGDDYYDDLTLVKNYELLCRAYEINGNSSKAELKNLATVCGRVFNHSKDPYVFDQMIRIFLTGGILNLQSIKQGKLLEYLESLRHDSRDRSSRNDCIGELMERANHQNIMERVQNKFENIDRVLTERRTGRLESEEGRETKWLLERVSGIVGMDFLLGILTQSTYA